MIKMFSDLGIEGNFFNLIKNIHRNSVAHIILYGEKLEAFPPRSGRRQGCPLLATPFQHLLEILDN